MVRYQKLRSVDSPDIDKFHKFTVRSSIDTHCFEYPIHWQWPNNRSVLKNVM